MTFTDDEIWRLKDVLCRLNGFEIHGGFTVKEFDALINRLETAERLIALCEECECRGDATVCRWFAARDDWRKAAGK